MKELLTSQGIQPELKEAFIKLLDNSPQQTKVAFVTTAAYGDYANPTWLEVYKKQLRDFDIQQIEDLDIRGENQEDLEKTISDKDIIFVNGGNTFFLLKYVKETGFDKVIKDHINKGKLYVGISAGSYIACPTIEQSHWKHQDRNDFGVTDLTALNFVPFLITAHFTEEQREAVEEGVRTTKYPVVALSDSQAILVKDNSIKVIGGGKREFYNDFKETE
ncbi:MAG: hypothetical protein HW400_918 [Candidatus Levybacteria bacterium]|nr:hypothetical protein [Candidatus Levybacteria bacterium]